MMALYVKRSSMIASKSVRVNTQNSDLIQALAQRGLVQDTEKSQNLPNAGENSGISSDPQS
jgi:hypothetical protein